MPLVRRLRIPAVFCALAVLVCELIARPYTTMGICDDGPYILMAQHLAATGHVAYNGWAAPMLTCQIYLGAAFIKVFGFSFTSVRMSTLLVAMALAFILQRTLVRAGITERNATISTLALVLSPLYLMLSVTYMSDITGLFAIVLCLYGCLRSLQSSSDRNAIAWLCFAVVTNALFGTSRQIAWLGVLVMVPSTLWLLRAQRRVFIAGAFAPLAGALFIFACMQWLKHQPYIITVPLIPSSFPVVRLLREFVRFFLDVPFLLLPIVALFLPQIRKCRPRIMAFLSALILSYVFLASYKGHVRGWFHLEPTAGEWIDPSRFVHEVGIAGAPPHFLTWSVMASFTIASLGGVLGLIVSLRRSHPTPLATSSSVVSWKQLGVLLGPFTFAYALLLIPSAATIGVSDRYLLGLIVVPLLCLLRYYQDRIHPRLPLASMALVAIMAIYGIAGAHSAFSFYRARVALASELRANGVPDTSVDNGWEYNFVVELQHSSYLNTPAIVLPANAYVPHSPLPGPADTCFMILADETPHILPLYGIAFDPNICDGPAPFAPVHYSRWPYRTPGTLYVVRYTPPGKP